MPVEEAAKLDFQEGERFLATKKYKEAMSRFQGILDQMPGSSLTDNAMLRASQIHQIQNNTNRAISLLEVILSRFPQSDALNDVKELLGKLLYTQKAYGRAAEILSTIQLREIAASKRSSLEKLIGSAFDQSQMKKEKLLWLLANLEVQDRSLLNREKQNEIIELVDESDNISDLEKIFYRYQPKFPSDVVCYKIAKLAFHSGDTNRAREWISTFLTRYPGHEWAKNAISLSETLTTTSVVDPLAVGLLVPLSGPNQFYGEQVLKGAAIAINLFGPLRPAFPGINIYIEDVGDDPQKAVLALERLLRQKKIIAAIGPLFSKESQAVALAASDFGLPVISLSASEGITEIGDTVFRNSLTKSEQAVGLAHLAFEILGVRRAAILYPQNNYGNEFMSFFWHEFVKRGGEIRGAESYDPDSADFGLSIKKLVGLYPIELRSHEICSEGEAQKRLRLSLLKDNIKICYPVDKLPPIVDFEGIFVPDGYEKALQVIPALSYYNVKGVQILGTNLWNTNELFQIKGHHPMNGVIFVDGFFKNKKDGPTAQFVQRYYSIYGMEPSFLEAQAYDTVSLVLEIISKLKPTSRSDFTEALRNIKDFPGVSGQTTYAHRRDAKRTLTPLTVDGDQIVELR